MTIARACRPPTQAACRRLAGRWWIAQHPPRRTDITSDIEASWHRRMWYFTDSSEASSPIQGFHPPIPRFAQGPDGHV